MLRFKIRSMITASALAGLCFSGVSWGEDCIDFVGIDRLEDKLRPNSLINRLPESFVVVTVAHIGPDTGQNVRGRRAGCEAAEFRVDEISIDFSSKALRGTAEESTEYGSVQVKRGETRKLEPGNAVRIFVPAGPNGQTEELAANEQSDMFAIRFVPERFTSRRCKFIANAQYHAGKDSAPTQIALIGNVGLPPRSCAGR